MLAQAREGSQHLNSCYTFKVSMATDTSFIRLKTLQNVATTN